MIHSASAELPWSGRTVTCVSQGPEPGDPFGNVKAEVLERFVSGYQRANFVDIIADSDWPE